MTTQIMMSLIYHYGCGCIRVGVSTATAHLDTGIVQSDKPIEYPECEHRNAPFKIETSVKLPNGQRVGCVYNVVDSQQDDPTPIICTR